MEFGLPKLDATAQQAVSEGASENSRKVGSLCNSGTDVFEKTLSFFWEKSLSKVNATAQQAFLKGTSDL